MRTALDAKSSSGGTLVVFGSTYQEDMFKDFCRTVHLTQNDNHLIVDVLLELSQVARHVHFQLCSDLENT